MAIIRKTQPIGIDKVVDQLQDNLETLGWSNYEMYSRAYKNETADGIIAEIYRGNEEYREIFFDDTFDATSFFILEDTQPVVNRSQRLEGTLGIIFQVKSIALKPNITHRADEEIHYDVLNALSSNVPKWETIEVVTGISNVYAGLNTDTIQFTDIGDFHVFRVNLTGGYSVNCHEDTAGVAPVVTPLFTLMEGGPDEIDFTITNTTDTTTAEVYADAVATGTTIPITGDGAYSISYANALDVVYTVVAILSDSSTHSSSVDGLSVTGTG